MGAVRHRARLPQHAGVPAVGRIRRGRPARAARHRTCRGGHGFRGAAGLLYIAGRSPHGGGSTALLERVVTGWFGKLLLLALLAFGAVDLVFTRTFSAAAAAEHITRNPVPAWQQSLDAITQGGEAVRRQLPDWLRELTDGAWNRQTVVTLIVLALGTVAGLIFFKGYTRGFVRLAVVTVVALPRC